MMTYNFCTIITFNYLPYAQVLRDSILEQQHNTVLHVFITDYKANIADQLQDKKNVSYIFIDDLCNDGIGKLILEKYFTINSDAFRWSMKGVLMNYLLTKFTNKIIYVDCDICFYNDFSFLFDKLDNHDVLLTPHWNVSLPRKDKESYLAAFHSGIYNAGFIAANNKAMNALDWYANASFDLCITESVVCHFSDQSHLNLMPIFFDNIKVLKHRGCNIAGWNMIECVATINENGGIEINGQYPLIFLHYSIHWFETLLSENSRLRSHAESYIAGLKHYGFNTEKIYEFINPKPEIEKMEKIKWWKRWRSS